MTDRRDIESLMEHPSHFKPRTKTKWPLSTKPPRCPGCNKQPPACTCVPKETP